MNDKNEIISSFFNVECIPENYANAIDLTTYNKIPINSLATLGSSAMSMTQNFRTIVQKTVTNGGKILYEAFDKNHNPISLTNEFKKDPGYLMGSYIKSSNTAQTHFKPVEGVTSISELKMPVDPTMMFMAMALMSIEKSISEIKEAQNKLINFVRDEKRSEITGNMRMLICALNDYKYNISDKNYISNMHSKMIDIRQSSEQNIDLFKNQISRTLKSKSLIVDGKTVKQLLNDFENNFKDYQLSVYLFGFSYFLEVLFGKNFNKDYLNDISNRIDQHTSDYHDLYSNCCNMILDFAESSVGNILINAYSKTSKGVGSIAAKTPLKKTNIDKKLKYLGEKADSFKNDKTKKLIEDFVKNCRDCSTRNFIENINKISALYNEPTKILFDSDNIYYKTIEN